jgi:hypothetical protein
VRTCLADEMKAWRVGKLENNGLHLLEPIP